MLRGLLCAIFTFIHFFQSKVDAVGCSLANGQLSALKSLYDNLGGPFWTWKSAEFGNLWNFDTIPQQNPCLHSWQGINCENCTTVKNISSITVLNLTGYNLFGQIPSVFSNITTLSIFSVKNNSITGTIPTAFGFLTNLKGLDLSSNSIRGKIPTELVNINNTLQVFFRMSFGMNIIFSANILVHRACY